MHFVHKLLLIGAAASALFVGTLGSSACSGGSGGGGGESATADVVYGGGATDEALDALLAATPVTDASQAATFTFPANGATVPSSPAPAFTWKVGAAPAKAPPPPAPTTAFLDRSFSDRAASSLASLLLSGVPSAYAHGTPTSGSAYFVVFSTTKDAKLLRVFTTETSYTPASAELAKLTGAGEAIHAVITHAEFDQNRVATDGGPFTGTEITFTLK